MSGFTKEQEKYLSDLAKKLFQTRYPYNAHTGYPEICQDVEAEARRIGCDWQAAKYETSDLVWKVYEIYFQEK